MSAGAPSPYPPPLPISVEVETTNAKAKAATNDVDDIDIDIENLRHRQDVSVKDDSTTTTQRKKCVLFLLLIIALLLVGGGLGAALGFIHPDSTAPPTSIATPAPAPCSASGSGEEELEEEQIQKGGPGAALGIVHPDSTAPRPTAIARPVPSSGSGEEGHDQEDEQRQYFCGCLECTSDVWSSPACDDNANVDVECFSCGSRITWLQGMSETERSACIKVSEEFPSGPCGPFCNPLHCSPSPPTPAPSLPRLDEPDPYKLIWSDEFDIDGAPDSTKWTFDIGDGCTEGICGWGNGEFQYYTDSPDNVIVENGLLRISAKRDLHWRYGKEYTSTRLVSRGKQAFRFGRIRLRARVNGCTAKGTWAALWMLPDDMTSHDSWPDLGEIDLMEYLGYDQNIFHGSVHTTKFNHMIGTQQTGLITKSETDWHIFEIDWQVDKIRFAVDKELYFVFAPSDVKNTTEWPFNESFYLILNIAVGGNWGASKGVDKASFEGDGQYMEVDWVRAYSL